MRTAERGRGRGAAYGGLARSGWRSRRPSACRGHVVHSQAALKHTLKTKIATFWSTSRNELWIKVRLLPSRRALPLAKAWGRPSLPAHTNRTHGHAGLEKTSRAGGGRRVQRPATFWTWWTCV